MQILIQSASVKFAKAMTLDLYSLTDIQNKIIQNKPQRPHKLPSKFRLTFYDT